ncbi:MAG: alanine racemase [Oscillospiraceae bacterium]|nr:alanine racemase [Oscillospiraceae bacterium]
MPQFPQRTWAEIDLDAVAANFRLIRSRLADETKIMAVVKADAYGHGDLPLATLFRDLGADMLAVSNHREAISLRQGGLELPILILGHTPPELAAVLAEYRITQTVFSAEYAQSLASAAKNAGVTLTIHIKTDSGMGRIGFSLFEDAFDQSLGEILSLFEEDSFHIEGIFTHFSSADTEEGAEYTLAQFRRFSRMTELLREQTGKKLIRHCCNSAAIFRYPQMQLDMVRPGIALYGLLPDPSMAEICSELCPVMAFRSNIIHEKVVEPGRAVSYGRHFTAEAPTRVGTMPVGYADGYSRRLSSTGHVLCDGQLLPILGNVCMDQTMVDTSVLPSSGLGKPVLLFGRDRSTGITLSADTIAAELGTIGYELTCLVGRRVERFYLQKGEICRKKDYLIPEKE